MGLKNYVIGIAIVTLFAFSIYSFSIGMISNNNPTSEIFTDSTYNKTISNLNNTMNSLSEVSENSRAVLSEAEPSLDYLFLIFYESFAIPLGMLAFITGGIATVVGSIFDTLGGFSSPLATVLNLTAASLIIVAILLITRAIRTGDER